MKVAIVTDNHAGCRNDSSVFTEYCISFFTDQFIPYLLENKIDTVLHLGDVFDRRKYINFQTLAQWRSRVFDIFEKNNIKLHIILGNHDVYYKNTNQVNSVYELLRNYKNIEIYGYPQSIRLDNLNIFLLPWIPKDKEEQYLKEINNTRADICMGHLEIKGFEMHAGQINKEHGLESDIFSKFDIVLTGHFHHKSSKDNIHYLGAPYQITWNDWGDIRGFHIFDTDNRDLDFIVNPKQIFKKIYYNDENKTLKEIINSIDFDTLKDLYIKIIVDKKDNVIAYEKFLENVYTANPADVSITEQNLLSQSEEDELDIAKDTLTILTEHVNALDIQQKDDLNSLFTSLYHEALTLDIE